MLAVESLTGAFCEAFAGLNPGRADVLRRALVKEKDAVIEEIRLEFVAASKALQRNDDGIARVWELVGGFAATLSAARIPRLTASRRIKVCISKNYHPAEFLASVLSNGKGFYSTLAYTLECRRLALTFLSPDVNASRWNFAPEGSQHPRRFSRQQTAHERS